MANTTALDILMRTYDRLKTRVDYLRNPYDKLTAVMNHILQGRGVSWSFMEANGTLVTSAAYNTGTITVTNGSVDVTGSGTTFTSGMVGRKLVVDGDYTEYTVATYTDGTTITIDRVYEGDTESGASYTIFDDTYSLSSDFGEMLVMRDTTNNVVLPSWTAAQHEEYYTAPTSSGIPTRYCLFGEDSSGYQQVKFWPSPGDVISYSYRYYKKPSIVSAETDTLDTPPKYDHVVIAHLVSAFTRDPQDDIDASVALQNMISDNLRQKRDWIEKTVPNLHSTLPLGNIPTAPLSRS